MSKNRQEGFIRTVIVIVIAIIVLIYFDDEVKRFIESGELKEAVKKILGFINYLWVNFIREPLTIFWDKVIVEILWEMIIKNALEKLKDMKLG